MSKVYRVTEASVDGKLLPPSYDVLVLVSAPDARQAKARAKLMLRASNAKVCLYEPGRCYACRCTGLMACPEGCSWVMDDLCSACAPMDADGVPEGVKKNNYRGLCERTGRSTWAKGKCGTCPPCENQQLFAVELVLA